MSKFAFKTTGRSCRWACRFFLSVLFVLKRLVRLVEKNVPIAGVFIWAIFHVICLMICLE